jgi:hypothetical protein
VLAAQGSTLIAGCSNGIFISNDHGQTWVDASIANRNLFGSKSLTTTSLAIIGETLYAGTQEGGLWSRPMASFKIDQTIVFNTVEAKTMGDQPFTLTATASSGLGVAFRSGDPTIASIDGNTVTLHKAGSVSVTAYQAGDDVFSAAPEVSQTFCVNPAKPAITADNSTGSLVLTSSATDGNQWFLNGTSDKDATGHTLNVTAEGSYTVQVTVGGCTSALSDPIAAVVTALQAEQSVQVYPTQVKDRISVTNWNGATPDIAVMDVLGKTYNLNTQREQQSIILDASSLNRGIYFLRIGGAKNNRVYRFVKE